MPPSQQYSVTTPLTVEQVKQVVHGHISAQARRVSFEPLPPSSNPFDERETFGAVASARAFGGGWAVQVYVFDRGPVREVVLVAIGSGVLNNVLFGLRDATILRKSRAVAEEVLRHLPRADRSAPGPGRGHPGR